MCVLLVCTGTVEQANTITVSLFGIVRYSYIRMLAHGGVLAFIRTQRRTCKASGVSGRLASVLSSIDSCFFQGAILTSLTEIECHHCLNEPNFRRRERHPESMGQFEE